MKMKKVILLCTHRRENYWDIGRGYADYPNMSYRKLKDWNELVEGLPLPGLGIYIKEKEDLEFFYLRINDMTYNEKEEPLFEFEKISKANVKSKTLLEKLPEDNQRNYFSSIDPNVININDILREIGENPPEEWRKLLTLEKKEPTWRDWIGTYFTDLESGILSSGEFEDRVADLLKALGFKVIQRGHTTQGSYCDGIAVFENLAIVYDCKNTVSFSPTADDIRALDQYIEDEKKVLGGEYNFYSAFIAKSFHEEEQHNHHFFTVESLIYLLYKKLCLGADFNLRPLYRILKNRKFSIETIDKEWITEKKGC